MGLSKITDWGYICLRCGHRWVPRGLVLPPLPEHRKSDVQTRKRPTDPEDPGPKPKEPVEEPRVCPNCKSPYWNKPRAQDAADEGVASAEAPKGKPRRKR
jgi:hypothetical protein